MDFTCDLINIDKKTNKENNEQHLIANEKLGSRIALNGTPIN
jgi:hypothetical protein